jgi:hypothetical protein
MHVSHDAIAKLARSSASTWLADAARWFQGSSQLETRTSVYTFRDGVLTARARKPTRAFDTPKGAAGVRLVGFLSEDRARGTFDVSPRWQPGASGLMLRVVSGTRLEARACLVTTATLAFVREAPGSVTRIHHANAFDRSRPLPPSFARPFAATG